MLKGHELYLELLARRVICELSEDFLVHERNITPLLTKFNQRQNNSEYPNLAAEGSQIDLWLALRIGDQKKTSFQSAKNHGFIEVQNNGKISLQN